jgi:hypothetical protein
MPLKVLAKNVKGRPGPARALELSVSLGWSAPDPGFLLSLDGCLSFGGRVISDHVKLVSANWLGLTPIAILRKGEECGAELLIPLAAESLRFVDERRGVTDVGLNIQVRFFWQEVLHEESRGQDWRATAGKVWAGVTSVGMKAISRSEWLRLLSEMEWNEIELFELHRLPLLADRNLAEALNLLRQAQTALQEGAYGDVLAKCRMAFESAAKHEIAGDDIKRGFEQLLVRAYGDGSPKSQAVNKIIASLGDYANLLGRHAQYPNISVERDEAEFGYACTLALFSLLTRRIARGPAK